MSVGERGSEKERRERELKRGERECLSERARESVRGRREQGVLCREWREGERML